MSKAHRPLGTYNDPRLEEQRGVNRGEHFPVIPDPSEHNFLQALASVKQCVEILTRTIGDKRYSSVLAADLEELGIINIEQYGNVSNNLYYLLHPEAWHEVGSGSGEPAFGAGWSNKGGVYETTAFRKDALGVVKLKGVTVKSSGGDTIFTLPPKYRPAATELFKVAGSGNHGEVSIDSNGVVTRFAGSAGTYLSISGLSFKANTME